MAKGLLRYYDKVMCRVKRFCSDLLSDPDSWSRFVRRPRRSLFLSWPSGLRLGSKPLRQPAVDTAQGVVYF